MRGLGVPLLRKEDWHITAPTNTITSSPYTHETETETEKKERTSESENRDVAGRHQVTEITCST